MVFEYVAAGFRYCVKLMVWQLVSEKSSCGTAGASELVVGVGHAICLENRLQAAFVERTVVSNESKPFDFRFYLFPHFGKNWGVVGVVPA